MIIDDFVVLVDKRNKILGTAPKSEIHHKNTLLHRGFSVFLFNGNGELLLQQRAKRKKTFPLIWSNSYCGHPMLNESNVQAAKRRMSFEVGINNAKIFEIISDYQYRVCMNDVCENEICPILVGFTNKKPKINKDEIKNTKWIMWDKFVKEVKNNPRKYSLWCEEETSLLEKNKYFLKLYKEYVK